MNKTISIHIGGALFTIEEDAYDRLEQYLNSIKSHFKDGEIVSDIEARVAERFQNMTGGSRVVMLADVEQLIQVMGRVEDIAAEGGETTQEAVQDEMQVPRPVRRLYIDYENRVLQGVAAGFAAYFDVDPTLMRILFVVLTLLSGFWPGIFAYIILAVVLPIARTPAEKMQMRGGPVTLSSFEQSVRDRAAEINEKHRVTSRLREFFRRFFDLTGTVLRGAGGVLLKIAGVLVALFASIALITLVVTFVNLAINGTAPSVQFPVAMVLQGGVYYAVLGLMFVIIAIPLTAALLAGISFARLRNIFTGKSFAALATLWLVSAVVMSVVWLRIGPGVMEQVRNLPEYRSETVSVPVSSFSKLRVEGPVRVVIQQGVVPAVQLRGTNGEIAAVSASINGEVLEVSHNRERQFCMFCPDGRNATVYVTAPTLASVDASSAAAVELQRLSAASVLEIIAERAANVFGEVQASSTIKITAREASRVTLSGTTRELDITAREGARVMVRELEATDVRVVASEAASVQVYATSHLKADARNAARIYYRGWPQLDAELGEAGKIERE